MKNKRTLIWLEDRPRKKRLRQSRGERKLNVSLLNRGVKKRKPPEQLFRNSKKKSWPLSSNRSSRSTMRALAHLFKPMSTPANFTESSAKQSFYAETSAINLRPLILEENLNLINSFISS